MGASVTQALVDAIGGKGTIIMTQGALGHTGAQGRAKGFKSVVEKYPDIKVLDEQPADWDVTKATRIWDSLLTKHPDITAAFFHNDDMALAAANVMQARGRDEHPGRRRRRHAAGDRGGDRRADATPRCATPPAASMAVRSWPAWRRCWPARRPAPAASPSTSSPTGRWSPSPTRDGMLWMQKHFLI